jgi:hypothetical protein
MSRLLAATLLWTLLSVGPANGEEPFACNLSALTAPERDAYRKLSQQLLHAVRERRELGDGSAFRLPSGSLLTAAEWASFERRCCPFFTFEIETAGSDGPLWLRLTGREGAKAFIRVEFGIEDADERAP